MATSRWRQADESDVLAHCPDHESKYIFYARTYTIGQGYTYSTTNDLILNLKHSPTSGSGPLYYKEQAITRCAAEFSAFFQMNSKIDFALVPMPPSKAKGDPEYDDRIERVAKQVANQCSNVEVFPFLYMQQSMGAAHAGGARDATTWENAMAIDPAVRTAIGATTNRTVAVVDDVLTSGGHYEAARRHLSREFPSDSIVGVFWAKADPPDEDVPF